MPKIGMKPIRREALVNAAIFEIGRVGTLDVTVSQIAKQAGVSSALAHHYMGGKDEIFVAAMRHILTIYRFETQGALALSTTPRERVEAIIRSSFSKQNFRPDVVSAWLNFYVKANASAPTKRLLTVYHKRILSNLTYSLRPLVGDNAPKVASGIAAMIDGFYLQLALKNKPTNKDTLVHLIIEYLDMSIERNAIKNDI